MGCCGGKISPGTPKAFNPEFKGPIKNRSCTDVVCCILFFCFVCGFIVVGLFAWLNGNPTRLLLPTDNQGRICGVNYGDLDLSSKNTLFYFDLTQCANPSISLTLQCPTTQICVPQCPSEAWSYYPDYLLVQSNLGIGMARNVIANLVDWSKYICTYGFNARTEFVNGMNLETMIFGGKCAPYYVPMTPVLARCIPEVAVTAYETVSDQLLNTNNETVTGAAIQEGLNLIQQYLGAQEIAEKIFADFTASWYWLLTGFGIAALVAFLWIVIMRWIAGIMIWITLLGMIGLVSFGLWYCYDEWNKLATVAGSDTSPLNVGFTTNLSTYLALRDTWLAFMIILAVVDLIIILLVIFLRKRILIAIEVIKQASKAVGQMITTLFYPIVTFLLVLIVLGFWVATALFLASTGDPQYQVVATNTTSLNGTTIQNGDACNITVISEWSNSSLPFYLDESVECVFVGYGGSSIFHQNVIWLQVIEVFLMLWIVNWVLALGQMTLAGAFASYYWAFRKPRDIPLLPLYSSFGRALRYHTGSMAFGALLIAIVQFIRLILEYIDHKLKGHENKLAKFMICCCKCCFWCLERFLTYLNRNAYIMIASYGKNFCWSAKEAFKLLLRNIIRAAVLDKVTDFVVFMGKLIVALGMGALSWAFFTDKFSSIILAPTLNYYWMLIIVIAIGAYFIAAGFFNTFGMAVDTLFLCFLEDLERNDGSVQKPYYMSKGLMKVLGKKNKKPKKKEKQKDS